MPVLFLTARDGVDDKIAGLTVGGDDYVTKSFSLAEVVARTRPPAPDSGGDSRGGGDGRLRFADVVLDKDSDEVWRSHTAVRLTTTEFTCSGASCSIRAGCCRSRRSSTTSAA